MFNIKFLKNDSVNGVLIEKGTALKVSRSIRNEKLKSGVAEDFVEKTNETVKTTKKPTKKK